MRRFCMWILCLTLGTAWIMNAQTAIAPEAATIRSTSSASCTVVNPTPYTPTWKTVTDFLDKHMK